MSILACLIGILTLMISVMMQVQQMKQTGRTEEEMALAMQNRDLLKKAKKIRTELGATRKKLEKEKATASVMAKLKNRKVQLTMELKDLKKSQDQKMTDAQLQKQVENMKKEVVAIQKERPPLAKRLKTLEEELKKRKKAPKPKASVKVQPRSVLEKGPDQIFFVECNSTGIVLLDAGKKKISTAAIQTSGTYAKYLDKVKKTDDSMVLFLIRKKGSDAFRWAASIADSKYKVTTGKLPLPNDGEIDLSLFNKK